jgi:hypothetical protein
MRYMVTPLLKIHASGEGCRRQSLQFADLRFMLGPFPFRKAGESVATDFTCLFQPVCGCRCACLRA